MLQVMLVIQFVEGKIFSEYHQILYKCKVFSILIYLKM